LVVELTLTVRVDWTTEDVDFCQRLSKLTNVIPIIGRADTLDAVAYTSRKLDLLRDLESSSIQPFLFGRTVEQATTVSASTATPAPTDEVDPFNVASTPTPSLTSTFFSPSRLPTTSSPPFAISCIPGPDDLEMDASLLMSPSYTPPLSSSDLQDLIHTLLDPENIAWLRHSAARKFLVWRERKSNEAIAAGGAASGGDSMLMPAAGLGIRDQIAMVRQRSSTSAHSGVLVPRAGHNLALSTSSTLTTSPFNLSSSALGTGLNDYTRARLRDHMISEERLAQVQLAKWASDLQRSLRNEKFAFERLAGAERAKWLLERIGEEVHDGQIGLLSSQEQGPELPDWAVSTKRKGYAGENDRMELPTWARAARGSKRRGGRQGEVSWRDPLGLCTLQDGVTRGVDLLCRVLGGGVIVGAVCLCIARTWGVEDKLLSWWGWGAP
jgi:hypothetical protein